MLYKLYISNDRVKNAFVGSWFQIESAKCISEYWQEKGYKTQIVIGSLSDLQEEEMKTLEQRYSELINKIGYDRLLNLPEQVKSVIRGNYDLETKVKMLELVLKTL